MITTNPSTWLIFAISPPTVIITRLEKVRTPIAIATPPIIAVYYAPGGLGVRVDSHVYGGYTIPPYYDSMIGKLIVTGSTRLEAIDRMQRALKEYIVRGIKTTIPLCSKIMLDPTYREGKITTKFMETFLTRTAKQINERIQ